MKIPKSIKICGRTIAIKYDTELVNRDDARGQAHYRYNAIVLQPPTKSLPICDEQIFITLLHEIIHWINFIGQTGLDERDVSTFSEILYQVLKDNALEFGSKK